MAAMADVMVGGHAMVGADACHGWHNRHAMAARFATGLVGLRSGYSQTLQPDPLRGV